MLSFAHNSFALYKDEINSAFSFPWMGGAISAYTRISPSVWSEQYQIASALPCLEDALLREQGAHIHHINPTKLSISMLLQSSSFHALLRDYAIRNLYLDRVLVETQEIASPLGVRVLGHEAELATRIEHKTFFRKLMNELEIPTPPSDTFVTNDSFFDHQHYAQLLSRFGQKFVVQLPGHKGGGRGTRFVFCREDFLALKHILGQGEDVLISSYLQGVSCSSIGCITSFGTLVSPLQTQLIDLEYVAPKGRGSGVFCGHDRGGVEYSLDIRNAIDTHMHRIGQAFSDLGMRGIFGIDWVVDLQNNSCYALECNPRVTAAFPFLSLKDIADDILPLELFHCLEHLHIPYEIQPSFFEERKHLSFRSGAQVVMINPADEPKKLLQDVTPGIWKIEHGVFTYIRPGLFWQDLKADDEILLINGTRPAGTVIASHLGFAKICHLVFPRNILDHTGKVLPNVSSIFQIFYRQFLGL